MSQNLMVKITLFSIAVFYIKRALGSFGMYNLVKNPHLPSFVTVSSVIPPVFTENSIRFFSYIIVNKGKFLS